MWQSIAEFHRNADWLSLVQFYGAIVGGVGVVFLLIVWLRALGSARRGRERIEQLVEDLKQMHRNAGEAEYRLEQKLNDRMAELEERTARKIDQKSDSARDRIEQTESMLTRRLEERTAPVAEKVGSIEAQAQELIRQVDAFRHRVDEVETRIPNLYDRLEEFRQTLARIFQSELGSVLESFDGSVSAVLNQMKTDLQMGIARIEGIESMVRSRQRAEHVLLGRVEEPELAEAPEGEVAEEEAEERAATAIEEPEEAGEATSVTEEEQEGEGPLVQAAEAEEEAEPAPAFEEGPGEEAPEGEGEPEQPSEPEEGQGEEGEP